MAVLPLLLLALPIACPPIESISPCSCKRTAYGLSVFCAELKTDTGLQNALKPLKEYTLSHLTVIGVNASTWKTDIFSDMRIDRLTLERIEVDDASFRPGLRHFRGLETSLTMLDIRKSFRNGHSLLHLQMDRFLSLNTMIMEDNHIPEVGNDWFTSGPTTLTTLIFERNGIEVLGDTSFASLVNLKLLAVAGNHLQDIYRSMFPNPANKLMSLDLANNKLHKLPTDLFANMPSLGDVNLENNLIHALSEGTFSSLLSLVQSLSLDGNPLQCEELSWVCKSRASVISGKCVQPGTAIGRTIKHFCQIEHF